MDPVSATTLAGVSIGTTAAGGLLGAIGNIFSGRAQAQAAKYQAGVAQINAQIARQNADYERNVGEVMAQQSGLRTRAEIGATRAAQGASGINVNVGSAQRVQASEREIGWNNQQIIRANAARRAYGYEVGAIQDVAQAGLLRMGAKTAQAAGDIGAASSLLSAAGSVSSKWLQAKTMGIYSDQASSYDPNRPGALY